MGTRKKEKRRGKSIRRNARQKRHADMEEEITAIKEGKVNLLSKTHRKYFVDWTLTLEG